MAREPDEIFQPGEGPIIDVTPRKEAEEKDGFDFDSGKPLIEQMLESEDRGPDRADKRPGIFDGPEGLARAKRAILVAFILGGLFLLLFLIFGRGF